MIAERDRSNESNTSSHSEDRRWSHGSQTSEPAAWFVTSTQYIGELANYSKHIIYSLRPNAFVDVLSIPKAVFICSRIHSEVNELSPINLTLTG